MFASDLLCGVVVLLVSMSEDRHGSVSVSAEMNQARSRRELHRFLDGDGREGLTCKRESLD